jgi:hypothetical protein
MLWRVRGDELSDAELVFELGRLCHLVADLCQPLHADGGPDHPTEKRVHPRYERDVDRRLVELMVRADRSKLPVEFPGLDLRGWSRTLERIALRSREQYEVVLGAYDRGKGLQDLEELTAQRLRVAVVATVALWRWTLERRADGVRGRESAQPWAWLAVILCLAYFAWRGPVESEASRWPGVGREKRPRQRTGAR